ncbi:uncharacterized protein Osi14 [Linepithema humile]|uniref:uncharacterized protein Osi14 n=1 Tax=Linepithema humile TaxID=83485 RepID=UPI00351E54F0
MNKLLVVLLAAYVAAGPAKPVLQSVDCFTSHDNEFFSCYFVKIIAALNKAAVSEDINIIDGVTFVRDTPMERTARNLQQSESEIIQELPQDTSERTTKLFIMFLDASNSFLSSHSLSFKKLSTETVSRALNDGRAKLKKWIWPLVYVGFKVVMIPLVASVILLVFKALILGKIALLLSGYAMYDQFISNKLSTSDVNQNFVPNPPIHDSFAGNWFAASEHPGYRSLDETKADAKIDAHNLAYSAHKPQTPNVIE